VHFRHGPSANPIRRGDGAAQPTKRAPARGPPSDRHPHRIGRAAVLGAGKVSPSCELSLGCPPGPGRGVAGHQRFSGRPDRITPGVSPAGNPVAVYLPAGCGRFPPKPSIPQFKHPYLRASIRRVPDLGHQRRERRGLCAAVTNGQRDVLLPVDHVGDRRGVRHIVEPCLP
jgi:hypothetical protein